MSALRTAASLGAQVVISEEAFDLLWERLGLGAYPTVFPLLSHGATHGERLQVLDAARRELQHAGLLDGPGIAPQLETWLRTLAAPRDDVHVRRSAVAGVLRACVVRRDDVCVRVSLQDETFTFAPVTTGSQVAAAVELLPGMPTGPGAQLSAPSAAVAALLAAGQEGPQAFAVAAVGLGAERADATAMAAALNLTHGVTQLGVSTLASGRRETHDHVVTVYDTQRGRYVVTERAAPDGSEWSTLRPATTAQVARAVAELLGEVRG